MISKQMIKNNTSYTFKKRKKGGMSVHTEMICGENQTPTKCLNTFLDEKEFIRIPTPDDGNCFYHTLTKFLQLSQNSSLPSTYHKELRKLVVEKMMLDFDTVSIYLVNNSNKNTFEQLEELSKDKVWNSDAGDVVTQYAAKALDMNIKIFDLKKATKSKKIIVSRNEKGSEIINTKPAEPAKIISYLFNSDINTGITVNMLRIRDGHFELLYPKEAGVVPPRRVRTTTTKTRKSVSPKPESKKKYVTRSTRKKQLENNKNKNKVEKNKGEINKEELNKVEMNKKAEESKKINNLENKLSQLKLAEEMSSLFNKE